MRKGKLGVRVGVRLKDGKWKVGSGNGKKGSGDGKSDLKMRSGMWKCEWESDDMMESVKW